MQRSDNDMMRCVRRMLRILLHSSFKSEKFFACVRIVHSFELNHMRAGWHAHMAWQRGSLCLAVCCPDGAEFKYMYTYARKLMRVYNVRMLMLLHTARIWAGRAVSCGTIYRRKAMHNFNNIFCRYVY